MADLSRAMLALLPVLVLLGQDALGTESADLGAHSSLVLLHEGARQELGVGLGALSRLRGAPLGLGPQIGMAVSSDADKKGDEAQGTARGKLKQLAGAKVGKQQALESKMMGDAAKKKKAKDKANQKADRREAKKLAEKKAQAEESILGAQSYKPPAPPPAEAADEARKALKGAERMRIRAMKQLKSAAKTGDPKELQAYDALNEAADRRTAYVAKAAAREKEEKRAQQTKANAKHAQEQIPEARKQYQRDTKLAKHALHRVVATGSDADLDHYLDAKAAASKAHQVLQTYQNHLQQAKQLEQRETEVQLAESVQDPEDPNPRVRLLVWKALSVKAKAKVKAAKKAVEQDSKKKAQPVDDVLVTDLKDSKVRLAEANQQVSNLTTTVKGLEAAEKHAALEEQVTQVVKAQKQSKHLKARDSKARALETQAASALKKATIEHQQAQQQNSLLKKALKELSKKLDAEKNHLDKARTEGAKDKQKRDVAKLAVESNDDIMKNLQKASAHHLQVHVEKLDGQIDNAERKLADLKEKLAAPAARPQRGDAKPSVQDQLNDQQVQETEALNSQLAKMEAAARESDGKPDPTKATGGNAKIEASSGKIKPAIKQIEEAAAKKIATKASDAKAQVEKDTAARIEAVRVKFEAKINNLKDSARTADNESATAMKQQMKKLEAEMGQKTQKVRDDSKAQLKKQVQEMTDTVMQSQKKKIQKLEDKLGKASSQMAVVELKAVHNKAGKEIAAAEKEEATWEAKAVNDARTSIVNKTQAKLTKLQEEAKLSSNRVAKKGFQVEISQVKKEGDEQLSKVEQQVHQNGTKKLQAAKGKILATATEESNKIELNHAKQEQEKQRRAQAKKERAVDRAVNQETKVVNKVITVRRKQQLQLEKFKEKTTAHVMAAAKLKVREEADEMATRTSKQFEAAVAEQSVTKNYTNTGDAPKKFGIPQSGLTNKTMTVQMQAKQDLLKAKRTIMDAAQAEIKRKVAAYEAQQAQQLEQKRAKIQKHVVAEEEEKRANAQKVRQVARKVARAKRAANKATSAAIAEAMMDKAETLKSDETARAKLALRKASAEKKERMKAGQDQKVIDQRAKLKEIKEEASAALQKATSSGDRKSFKKANKLMDEEKDQAQKLTVLRKQAAAMVAADETEEAETASEQSSKVDVALEDATDAVNKAVLAPASLRKSELQRAEAAVHHAQRVSLEHRTEQVQAEYHSLQAKEKRSAKVTRKVSAKAKELGAKVDQTKAQIAESDTVVAKTRARVARRKKAFQVSSLLTVASKEAEEKGAKHVSQLEDRVRKMREESQQSLEKLTAATQKVQEHERDAPVLQGKAQEKKDELEAKLDDEKKEQEKKSIKAKTKVREIEQEAADKEESLSRKADSLAMKIKKAEDKKAGAAKADQSAIDLELVKLRRQADDYSKQARAVVQKMKAQVEKTEQKAKDAKADEKKKIATVQAQVKQLEDSEKEKAAGKQGPGAAMKETQVKMVEKAEAEVARTSKEKIAASKAATKGKLETIKKELKADTESITKQGKKKEDAIKEDMKELARTLAARGKAPTLKAEVADKKKVLVLKAKLEAAKAESETNLQNLKDRFKEKTKAATNFGDKQIKNIKDQAKLDLEGAETEIKEKLDASKRKASSTAKPDELDKEMAGFEKVDSLITKIQATHQEVNAILTNGTKTLL